MNLFPRLAIFLIFLLATALAWAQLSAAPTKTDFLTQLMPESASIFTTGVVRVDVKVLPLAQAIKTVQGNGRSIVYVITDPDCRYCKDLDRSLRQIKNVTIYRFEYPLTQLHANAANIAKQIWCAPNRAQAWDEYAKHGVKPTNDGTCANPIDANMELAARLDLEGTPDLISSDGRLHVGTMPFDALEQFIGAAG